MTYTLVLKDLHLYQNVLKAHRLFTCKEKILNKKETKKKKNHSLHLEVKCLHTSLKSNPRCVIE